MDQKKIGIFIALLRRERGITQAELGEKIGVTNKTVSRWENGNYMPDIATMLSLCEEFEISINELLSGQRLGSDEFRKKADENVVGSLKREKAIWKKKKRRNRYFSVHYFFTGRTAEDSGFDRRIGYAVCRLVF